MMIKKKQLLLFFLFPFLCFNCKSDDDQPTYDSSFGAIYVTVKQANNLISDAVVSTSPESSFFQTDFSGSVIVDDLEPQTYQIIAYHPAYGTGTGAAIVNQGQVTSVDINLIEGVFENPIVEFISPVNGNEIDIDMPVEFSATVFDNSDNPQSINLEWTSDLDGLLSTQSASANGIANITVDELSEGDHIIQIKAIDSDGFIGGAIINVSVKDIPNSVVLSPLQGFATGTQLSWSTSDESDFLHYKVYRSLNDVSNFEVIEIINDVNTTSYLDNAVNIGQNYYYQIGVNLTSGEERLSNIQFINFEGVSIYVGTQIEKMIVDPERPYIYAIDRVNNALLFVNTDQGILEKTISVGSSPTDLDMSLDGQKIYIANFGSTQINVIDIDAQEIDFSFFVDTEVGTWDGNPYRITVLSGNRLAFTSEDQHNNIKIVNASNGTNLLAGESVYQPNLFSNPEGNILYVAESGSTGSQVIRFNISGSLLNEVDRSSSGSAWRRNGFITTDGQYIFFRKQKILSTNLQSVLGTFPDEVYTSNRDGSIVLGEEQYYNGNDFSIIGNLPVISTVMTSDPNEDIFYIYNTTSSSIVVFLP